MENQKVSPIVIKRLAFYKRLLEDMLERGVDKVSSSQLSIMTGSSASQIRQDLNHFGGFGQQGFGYHVPSLIAQLSSILGLNNDFETIVVGAGNIGKAIVGYISANQSGFHVKALFDTNSEKIGSRINGIAVLDAASMLEYLSKNPIDIGIIATDKEGAQTSADIMVEGKVRGIWNFAPIGLEIPDGVAIENVHLSDSLWSLAYHTGNQKSE